MLVGSFTGYLEYRNGKQYTPYPLITTFSGLALFLLNGFLLVPFFMVSIIKIFIIILIIFTLLRIYENKDNRNKRRLELFILIFSYILILILSEIVS